MTKEFVSTLQRELDSVREREREIANEEEAIKRETAEHLRQLSEKRAELEARRRHLQALLALEGVEPKRDGSEPVTLGDMASERGVVSLADQVYYYLLEVGQEQHYKDITSALQAKGIEITGKDPALTLVANIHADERFKRPHRGVYGLAEWYPKNMQSVGTRKKRTRRKKHRTG